MRGVPSPIEESMTSLRAGVELRPLDPQAHLIVRGSATALLCPRCGDSYLHHRSVVTFDRSEDAETVLRTGVEVGKTTVQLVPQADSGNPSPRRDGLVIQFWCEKCGGGDDGASVIELTLAQHKGETEVSWRFTPLDATRP